MKMWLQVEMASNVSFFCLLMDILDIKGQSSDFLGSIRTFTVSPKVILALAWDFSKVGSLSLRTNHHQNRHCYFQDLPSFEIK